METTREELLGVTVDPAMVAEAKRIYAMTKWIFGLGLFFSLLHLGAGLIHASYSNPEKYRRFLSYYLQLKLSTGTAVLYCVIIVGQLFAYLRFARTMARGLEASDSETFNQSLRSLVRYNQFFLCGMILVIVTGILAVWVQIDFAHAAARVAR